jgi:hypothetical protein
LYRLVIIFFPQVLFPPRARANSGSRVVTANIINDEMVAKKGAAAGATQRMSCNVPGSKITLLQLIFSPFCVMSISICLVFTLCFPYLSLLNFTQLLFISLLVFLLSFIFFHKALFTFLPLQLNPLVPSAFFWDKFC